MPAATRFLCFRSSSLATLRSGEAPLRYEARARLKPHACLLCPPPIRHRNARRPSIHPSPTGGYSNTSLPLSPITSFPLPGVLGRGLPPSPLRQAQGYDGQATPFGHPCRAPFTRLVMPLSPSPIEGEGECSQLSKPTSLPAPAAHRKPDPTGAAGNRPAVRLRRVRDWPRRPSPRPIGPPFPQRGAKRRAWPKVAWREGGRPRGPRNPRTAGG